VSFALEAYGLSKSFGDLEVLRGVSLRVRAGDTVALLGPSGCGKTTLLRILLGLETESGGVLGGRLERSGYLPQGVLLLPWKTLIENVELPLRIAGMRRDERRRAVEARLPEFGLEGFAGAYPHQLSGGMKQRAALLRAVMTGASVLVLDEPFGALDTHTRHRLQDWLSSLVARLDRTMLFVTHDIDEAVALARRVAALTDRPARVLGERAIDLSQEERRDRLGRAFLAARDTLLDLIANGG